jgi:hypothetical protein
MQGHPSVIQPLLGLCAGPRIGSCANHDGDGPAAEVHAVDRTVSEARPQVGLAAD